MPQQPSGFDFSALNQTPSTSATGFDFSGTPLAAPASAPRSFVGRALDTLLTPMISPAQVRQAAGVSALPDVSLIGPVLDALSAIPDVARNLIAQPGATVRGFAQGAAESAPVQVARNLVTQPAATIKGGALGLAEGGAQLTDPVNIAALLAGGAGYAVRPALVRALRALPEAERALVAMRASGNLPEVKQILGEIQSLRSQADISRALLRMVRGADLAAGGVVAAHGTERLMNARSLPEAGAGLAELGFGALGMKNATRVPELGPGVGSHVGELPAARGYVVTPSGAAVPTGQPVPDTVVPDASFVRAVPAEYARREPAGLLPESAASASEFVVLPDGTALRRSDLPAVEGRGTLPAAGPQPVGAGATAAAAKGKRTKIQDAISRLAAIADRTPEGAPIYSSDPNARSITGLPITDLERSDIRRMLAELETAPFTRHTFNETTGRGGDMEIVPGGAGAPVYQDILAQHGTGNPSRQTIIDALHKVLNGEPTVYGPAIREVARRGVLGNRRAILPPDAGDPQQTGAMTDKDFRGFEMFVDRLSGQDAYNFGDRITGEEGRVNPGALQHVGGAVAGGVAGYASGDDTTDRIKRGLIGATVGGMVPALIGRGGVRIPPQLADLGERTAAAGITPETIDARLGGQAPLSTARPTLSNPQEAVYTRVLQQGGRVTGPTPADVVPLPTTARPAAQPRQPLRDPMAGVDVFLERFPQEYRDGIKQVITDNAGFQAQRRGAVSSQQTADLANQIRVDWGQRVKPGTAGNASAIQAHIDALTTAQAKLQALAERVAKGQNTDGDLVALEQARASVQTLTASALGLRAESGRALAAWKVLGKVIQSGNPTLIRRAADGIRGRAADFAEQFAALPNDPMVRYRWLQEHRDTPTRGQQAMSAYMASLLSGLATQARNAVGNSFSIATGLLAHPFGVGADVVRSAVTGTPRTLLLSELKPQAVGIVHGLSQGLSDAAFVMRNGLQRATLEGALSAGEHGKLALPGAPELPGGLKNPLNIGPRLLDASDALFRGIARQQELFGAASTQATREGLKGDALQRRIADLMTGVSPEAQAIQDRADLFARRAVFREPNGPILQGLTSLATKVPAVRIAMPFFGFAGRSLKQGLETSAAGFLMSPARSGGREGAQALGRASLGSLLGGYFVWKAINGELTGSAPEKPGERGQFYETGKQANAIKFGDHWYSFQAIQPLSTQMQIIANAVDTARRGDAGEGLPQATFKTFMASISSLADQSFMEGVNQLLDLVLHPERTNANKVLGRYAAGAIPLSSALRSVTRATDATRRNPRGFVDTLKADLPGLSSTVPAMTDRFGRVVMREGSPLARAGDPFATTTERHTDPVLELISRLGITVGGPSDAFTIPGQPKGTRLPEDQARALETARGQARYAALSRLLQQPAFTDRPVEVQQRIAQKVITQASERVTNLARGLARRRQPLTLDVLTAAIPGTRPPTATTPQ